VWTIRLLLRNSSLVVLALALVSVGCFSPLANAPASGGAPAAPAVGRSVRHVYLAPNDPSYDLVTPDGIHVKTNDQYKTEAERKAAAEAIDRYWLEVRDCALQIVSPEDRELRDTLIPEFPRHLSIEIASDWQIVEGPVTHRKQQAFPSIARPGAWATASRAEEGLYVKVVPELNGLARQMAGELNLYLGGNTNTLPTELSNLCVGLPCFRFAYDNAPSQAWAYCSE
jgi:hypothetical protein